MLDDEKYPKAVRGDGENAPEVAWNTPADRAPEFIKERPPDSSDRFAGASLPFDSREIFSTPTTEGGQSLTPLVAPSAEDKGKRYCGLRKKTLSVVLGITVVLVIASLAGGLGGGLAARRHSSSLASSNSTSGNGRGGGANGSSDRIVTPPITNGPIKYNQRSLAVSGSLSTSRQHIQLFYQHLNSSSVFYQRVENDSPKGRYDLRLDIAPNWGTPLAAAAAAAVNSSDPITAQLFYIHTDGNATNIVQATIECSSKDDTCDTKSNDVVSSNVTEIIRPDTKLAVTRLGDGFVRVYYQVESGDIWALNGDKASTAGWSSQLVAGAAFNGTGLVSFAVPDSTRLYLVYVSASSKLLRCVEYNDRAKPGPSNPVGDSPGSEWLPTNSIAGAYASQGTTHIYYARPDNGTVSGFYQLLPQYGTWKPHHDKSWGQAEGGIATIGWSDQMRLFYFEDHDLVMNSQNATVWNPIPQKIHEAGDGAAAPRAA